MLKPLCLKAWALAAEAQAAGSVARGERWSQVGCPQVAREPMGRQNYTDGRFKCMPHMMAHAAMVEPLARFVLDAVGLKGDG